jgi:hypothetical protein
MEVIDDFAKSTFGESNRIESKLFLTEEVEGNKITSGFLSR